MTMNGQVDLQHLNEVSDNDAEFRGELIAVYLTDTARLLKEMELHFLKHELAAVSSIAHSIKGASANVGARVVHESAFVVERLCREQAEVQKNGGRVDLAQIAAAVVALKTEFFAAKDFLESL